jgi:hypothetical protein
MSVPLPIPATISAVHSVESRARVQNPACRGAVRSRRVSLTVQSSFWLSKSPRETPEILNLLLDSGQAILHLHALVGRTALFLQSFEGRPCFVERDPLGA